MEAETVKAIDAKLTSICPHESCTGRDAMVEAARWLIDEPAGWIAELDGQRLRLYAMAGDSVHALAAECAAQGGPGSCEYVILEPVTGGEDVRSTIEHTIDGAEPTSTAHWSFQLGRELAFSYELGADGAAHGFALALLASINDARRSTPHR